MGCQACKFQGQNEEITSNSELSSILSQSIIQELPAQIPWQQIEIQSFPQLQNDTMWIQVPSIEFGRNDEFILDHTSSYQTLNELTTLKQIIQVMTEKGNLNGDVQNKKPNRIGKSKGRRIQMKDLEKEF